MSLILAGGNKDFLILGGEQRVMGKDGSVVSENFRKVYRLSDDLLVAFAGKIRYCEEALSPIRQYNMGEADLFVNVEISYDIENKIEELVKQLKGTEAEQCFFGIILCGKTFHGHPKDAARNPFFMHMYIYNGSLTVNRRLFKDSGIRYMALCGSGYDHMGFCREMFRKRIVFHLKDTKKIFDETFQNGAAHDKTVNSQVIYEILEN